MPAVIFAAYADNLWTAVLLIGFGLALQQVTDFHFQSIRSRYKPIAM